MTRTQGVVQKRKRENEESHEEGAMIDSLAKKMKDVDPDETVCNPEVRTKYVLAGKITKAAMQLAIEMCMRPNMTTREICLACDDSIRKACEKEYIKTIDPVTKTTLAKGICFPTTVSVNQVACHYSSSNEEIPLNTNDIVKICLGCHVDGYPTVACQTLCVHPEKGESQSNEMEITTEKPSPALSFLQHRRLSLIYATQEAMRMVLQGFRPGKTNVDITNSIDQVARKYNLYAMANAFSHEMKRYILNGQNVILNRSVAGSACRDAREFTIECDKVYHIDILFGMLDKPSATNMTDVFSFPTHVAQATSEEERKLFDLVPSEAHESTIFARNINRTPVRPETANQALKAIKHTFLTFPFIGRSVFPDSEVKSALGVKSLVENNLLDLFPVLESKRYVNTARACCSVIVTSKETQVICGSVEDHGTVSQIGLIDAGSVFASLPVENENAVNHGIAQKMRVPLESALSDIRAQQEQKKH